jgi:Carboxypeptidase regulatory-like domain
MINYPASTRRRRALFGRLLPLGTLVVLTFALGPRAGAQSDQAGRVEGVVYDSVHARPLAAVRVVAVRADSQASVRAESMSDSAGRYHIESLPPGRYSLGFESALLDSLEIVLPPRAVTIVAGSAATVKLAMPSAAKLRAAVCPGANLLKETGVVYGQVVNAETESPLAGVVVALLWRDLAVWDANDHKIPRTVATPRTTSVTTDEGGWYRACGVPTGTWMSMQLQQEGRVGPVLRTLVDDTLGIAIHHLSYSAATARDTAEVVDSAGIKTMTGTAALTGVVRGPAGAPISSAQVHVLAARGTAVTDAEGRFTLSGLPAGTHELEVRQIGYELTNAWVELRGGATTRRDVSMRRVVTLDSIRVVAIASRYKEFAAHKKMALGGIFLGPDDIMRRHFNRTSDIIRGMPGYVVENSRSGRTRVYAAGSANRCVVNVAINGFSGWSDDPDAFSVDDVSPSDVGAIELGSGAYGGSPDLDHGYGCGTIVIWTKR